jgi:hypothetical protein
MKSVSTSEYITSILNWYENSIGLWPIKRKKRLQHWLIYGYMGFGIIFGLLQYTGIGELRPAIWFSKAVAFFVPMMGMIEQASPNPDGTRFFYAVMWIGAFISAVIFYKLFPDVNAEFIETQCKTHPYKIICALLFLALAEYVIFGGLKTDPKNLGNWKLFSNYSTMAFYGSPVLMGFGPISAMTITYLKKWRIIWEAIRSKHK